MNIYLIRHGQCYDSCEKYYSEIKKTMDPPLTSIGVQQAKSLSLHLSYTTFDKIYSSDLIRSIQTSEILKAGISTDIVLTKAFREIDMGFLDQQSWSDYPDIYDQWKLHYDDIAYPGGENGQAVWNRCKEEMNKIIEENYDCIAIVCHGGTIRSILCGLLGIPQEKRFYFGFPIENCSISKIKYADHHFYVHTVNEYSHILSEISGLRSEK